MGRSSGKYPSRTKFNKKKKISKSRKLYWCQRKLADQELAKSKVLHDHMYNSENSDKHNNYIAEQQTPGISVNIEQIENYGEIVHNKIIEECIIEEPVFDEFSFISQEEYDWSAQQSKPTENPLQYSCPPVNEDKNSLPTTTGPKPKFIIIVRKFKRQQRCKLPEASSSVQNGSAKLEEFSETGDIQDCTSDQTSYTPEVEANDEKVENIPFEFVDCACQIPPDQDGKDFISSEQDMLEEEFETKPLTCVKIKNKESASISLKRISESQEDVKVPYAINHELFIKDEIIEEEYETE